MKATIRVFGNVQAVGYRALVKFLASRMEIKGLIRNLDDGSVEIFAEAPEQNIEKLIKAIDIKGRPEDILSLHVDKIETYSEGEPGYRGPWRKYEFFEIDYGEEEPRPLERDMAESLEWAKLYFTKLVTEFTNFRSEFRDYRNEFRDYRQEFRDYRQEFREFKEELMKISKETLQEVKELRKDLKTMLDERITKIERDIAEIKAKIGLK